MALHWRPVGPEPAHTYWLRRAVVVLGVAMILSGLLQMLGVGDDEDRVAQEPPEAAAVLTPSPSPSASADPSASPGATPTPSASAAPCTDEALTVEAAAAEDTYAVGDQPRLQLEITNTGAAPCVRDLGQAAVELQVVSGGDRIWSSDDCAPGGDADLTVLQPGEAEASTVTWPGTRSRPGCTGDDEPAEAGTYRVVGRVGERLEQGAQFVLQ